MHNFKQYTLYLRDTNFPLFRKNLKKKILQFEIPFITESSQKASLHEQNSLQCTVTNASQHARTLQKWPRR